MSLYSAASGIQLLSNQFPTHKVEKDLVTIFGRILLRHDWWLNEFVRSLTTKNVWEVNFRIYLFWPKICWDLGPGVKCNCYHISWYESTVDAKNFLYMLSRQEECHCISCTLFVSGISIFDTIDHILWPGVPWFWIFKNVYLNTPPYPPSVGPPCLVLMAYVILCM